MKLNKKEEDEFVRLFIKKHGVPPIHTSLSYNKWSFAVWNDSDISEIISKPRKVLKFLDKIWKENMESRPGTTVQPLTAEMKIGKSRSIIYHKAQMDERYNILTNPGMADMAQNRTGDSSNSNTHMVVGDDATGEDVDDDQLGNQLAYKEFDTDGDRSTSNQTERYAAAFFRADFASDVTLKEAGVATGTTPPTDILVSHVTYADKPVGSGQTMTAQMSVTHKNGTEV